jgi:hypothetical protein
MENLLSRAAGQDISHIFWNPKVEGSSLLHVTPCRLVNSYRHFQDSQCPVFRVKHASITILRSVGDYLPIDTASHLKRAERQQRRL